MIRTLTAYTREIDEADVAVAELIERLDLENRLLDNAVGILAFHPEFLDSDIVKALSEALPFATVGYTTPSIAVEGGFGGMIFSVMVLTSDDVVFNAGGCASVVDAIRRVPCANSMRASRRRGRWRES